VTTVCVPSDDVRAALSGLAVETIIWDWNSEPPPGLDRVVFAVPPYMAGPPPAESVARLPALQVVQLLSAGYEAWPPMLRPGVVLCNGRGIHGGSTAELAVGGLIAVLRELPKFAELQRQGSWQPDRTDGLDGKRVLVLGVGDIGSRVVTAVAAFGAHVTQVGRTARAGVLSMDAVPSLLADQDVVVLALPYSAATHHLVDAAFLAALPDGAVVVNVARGAVVDTDALTAELSAGRLRAFLDVTDPEPLPADHPLWRVPNLLLTPHIGGGTARWLDRAHALLREQVGRFVAGEPLRNVVG
jgi:phosphoglycerate dehydrogenase-like enzyme